MTTAELIEVLEDALEFHPGPEGEGPPVRIAVQPRYPFEHSLAGVLLVERGDGPVVYLGEGAQLQYLPEDAREVWR